MNSATVTERDIVYTGHVEPTDLIDIQDRTAIPEADVLSYGAAMDLAPIAEKKDLIASFKTIYDEKVKNLESKYSTKQSSRFGRVKDVSEKPIDEGYFTDPNRYPRDIVGT